MHEPKRLPAKQQSGHEIKFIKETAVRLNAWLGFAKIIKTQIYSKTTHCFAESDGFKRSVLREHSRIARVSRQFKCDMAELRQRKSAPDNSKVPSYSTSVEADGRAGTRRQRQKDSPLLLFVAPLIVLFNVALVSSPDSYAS